MKAKRDPIAKLPSGVGVSKVIISGNPYWRVRSGKKFTGGEIRIRHFTDLDAARKWIFGEKPEPEKPVLQQIQPGVVNVKEKLGSNAFTLSTSQLSEAQDAYRRLPKGASLTKVVTEWLERCAPSGGIKSTAQVSDEFIVSRRSMGVRPGTLVQYESYLRAIKEEFGGSPIADIERSGIEDWLSESDWSPRTRKNYLVTLTTLLNFAQDREYCLGNPASRIERPILDDNPPGILTVAQTGSLLTPARDGVPEKFDPKPSMITGLVGDNIGTLIASLAN